MPTPPLTLPETLSALLHGQTLVDALTSVEKELRRKPALSGHLLRLDLLCLLEDWDRAERQAETCTRFDVTCLPLMTLIQALTACERAREKVFSGNGLPTFLCEAPAWVALQLEALRHQTTAVALADTARNAALSQAPATAGVAEMATTPPGNTSFAWITDSDTRLGPLLEVFSADQYLWVPFEQLTGLEVPPPQALRDFAWLPVVYELDGARRHGFMPGRYPDSARAGDGLAVGRETRWDTEGALCGETGVFGLGQKVFSTDVGDLSLFDLRELRFSANASA